MSDALIAEGFDTRASTSMIKSACGLKVVPHTVDERLPRPGCAKCSGQLP